MKFRRSLCKKTKTTVTRKGTCYSGFNLEIKYHKWMSRHMQFIFKCDSVGSVFILDIPRDLTMSHIRMTEIIEKSFDDKILGSTFGLIFVGLYQRMIVSNPWLNKRSTLPLEENVTKWFTLCYNLQKAILSDMQSNTVRDMSQNLPGVAQIVLCPCSCGARMSVWRAVQHLNDTMKWTRAEIADWLDELQDNQGYDFTFSSDNKDRQPAKFNGTVSVLSDNGWKEIGYIKESGV